MTQMMPIVPRLPQDRPELQVPVATVPEPQQGWPIAPQAEQVSGPVVALTQAKPVLQVPPLPALPVPQQRWVDPPQARQLLPASPVPAMQAPPLWHWLVPSQQAALSMPQVVHIAGAAPAGFAQPSPLLQVLLAQHASPLPPHDSQRLAPPSVAWQERPVPQEFAPPQQAWPEPPQASQVMPPSPEAWQEVPVLQAVMPAPWQQA
jgi:hypothetical protein